MSLDLHKNAEHGAKEPIPLCDESKLFINVCFWISLILGIALLGAVVLPLFAPETPNHVKNSIKISLLYFLVYSILVYILISIIEHYTRN